MKANRVVPHCLALWVSVLLILSPLAALAGGPAQPIRGQETTTPIDQVPPQPTVIALSSPIATYPQAVALTKLGAPRHPKLDTPLARIAESAAVSSVQAMATAQAVDAETRGSSVLVEIVPAIVPATPDSSVLQAAIAEVGGLVTGVSKLQPLIQAWLPASGLTGVASRSDVAYIRIPEEATLLEGNVTSEGVGIAAADTWHALGYRGAGVKVGIIDAGFLDYAEHLGTEITASVVVSNFVAGETNSQVSGTTNHGTACAEIVADMAPDAQLFLAKISTALELEEAVNWLIGQHINVISTSLGWYAMGPGDGTGYLADIVNAAAAAGITWVTAAGNGRQSHWGGAFSDPEADTIHNFNGTKNVDYFGPGDGSAYLYPADVTFRVFLRWDDWGVVNQDYDLYVFRYDGVSLDQIATSDNAQSGQPGQTPVEAVAFTTTGIAAYGIVVTQYSATRPVNLELFVDRERLDEIVTARSLAQPADVQAAISVAAANAAAPYFQEAYSSEGPTNGPGGTLFGGFLKPDIAGYTNVSTVTSAPDLFNGTSAATPHVAGAAALVAGAFPTYTNDQVRAYLEGRAVDMGAPGRDTAYGWGRLFLREPPIKMLQLTVSKNGDGSGSVTSMPPGIDCGSACSAGYAQATQVTLTATPADGSSFTGWSGACSGTGSCTVSLDAARLVTATFTRNAFTLSVSKNGDGSGSVTSMPPGINCGSTCSASYTQATAVTLTATPAADASFTGWSGACSGTGSCTVIMNVARFVTATFTHNTFTLSVSKNGDGSGSVTSMPLGIDCGITCSASYTQGTQITLTATPAADSSFSGWSGACSGTGSCTVSMNAAKSVTATFARNTLTLNVSKNGDGSGSVTSIPPGIDCGSACSSTYTQGTQVTLTAIPAADSSFSGWSGACSGTGGCTVSMDAAKSLTATFTRNTFTLNVAPYAGLRVVSAPEGIDCGTSCRATFPSGTEVKLDVVSGGGGSTIIWAGDCTGMQACKVTMDHDHAIELSLSGRRLYLPSIECNQP